MFTKNTNALSGNPSGTTPSFDLQSYQFLLYKPNSNPIQLDNGINEATGADMASTKKDNFSVILYIIN